MKSIEDPELTNSVGLTHTRALLANGRLHDAQTSIDRLKAAGLRDTDPALQELLLHLQSSRGATSAAASLARQLPEPGQAASPTLALAAIQAALRNGDLITAKDWQSRAPVVAAGALQSDADISWELARSLIADREGNHVRALQSARRAAAAAEGASTPETRIQTGTLLARLLLDRKQPEAAASVLGDLNTFADSDYRVAWATLALYRYLGDSAMIDSTLARAEKLRGERELVIEPVL